MKRLRWYDYLTINLFWLGLNIRNTALTSIFMPYLVTSVRTRCHQEYRPGSHALGRTGDRHAGAAGCRNFERPFHFPVRAAPAVYPGGGVCSTASSWRQSRSPGTTGPC